MTLLLNDLAQTNKDQQQQKQFFNKQVTSRFINEQREQIAASDFVENKHYRTISFLDFVAITVVVTVVDGQVGVDQGKQRQPQYADFVRR